MKKGRILANSVAEERNDKKRDCTRCRKKLVDGSTIVVVRNPQGKPRAHFCDHDCQQTFEHEYLEASGFYEGAGA